MYTRCPILVIQSDYIGLFGDNKLQLVQEVYLLFDNLRAAKILTFEFYKTSKDYKNSSLKYNLAWLVMTMHPT